MGLNWSEPSPYGRMRAEVVDIHLWLRKVENGWVAESGVGEVLRYTHVDAETVDEAKAEAERLLADRLREMLGQLTGES